MTDSIFNYCGVDSKDGDTILFFDYLPAKKGDHHDFYGNQRYIDILCDIAKHSDKALSEYDLESLAEMVKKGYVISENGNYSVTMPVYLSEQYRMIDTAVERYMLDEIAPTIKAFDLQVEKVVAEHSPSHLKDSVLRISGHNKFFHTICAPAKIMIDRKFLSSDYCPNEIPGAFIILGKQ